jgi:hypothetical protein
MKNGGLKAAYGRPSLKGRVKGKTRVIAPRVSTPGPRPLLAVAAERCYFPIHRRATLQPLRAHNLLLRLP